jgi:transcriptional regulator with XRE-family HTH domain
MKAANDTGGADEIRALFGKNLKRLRAIQSISQMTLADRANLTHNFVNDIENGKKWISVESLAKLSSALQVEPYQFFLPDSVQPETANSFFTVYLNDFSDNLQKMVGELKDRYLQDQDEN